MVVSPVRSRDSRKEEESLLDELATLPDGDLWEAQQARTGGSSDPSEWRSQIDWAESSQGTAGIGSSKQDAVAAEQLRNLQGRQQPAAPHGSYMEYAARTSSASSASKEEAELKDQSVQSIPPTLGFLNRAHVCAVLSQRVYAKDEQGLDFSQADSDAKMRKAQLNDRKFPSFGTDKQVKLDPKSPPIPASFEAKYVKGHIFPGSKTSMRTADKAYHFCQGRKPPFVPCDKEPSEVAQFMRNLHKPDPGTQPSSDSPADPFEMQWGIWYVTDLGYVVAFKGSSFLEDWMANGLISSKQLRTKEPYSSIALHEGISTRAKDAWADAWSMIEAHAQENPVKDGRGMPKIPVLLTGHSLGGGYAATTLLHILALRAESSKDRLMEGMQLEGAYTFGAPLTLLQAAYGQPGSPGKLGSYEAARSLLGDCKLHNFVNGVDVVPRLLGTALDEVMNWVCGVIQELAKKEERQAGRWIPNAALRWDPEVLKWKAKHLKWAAGLLQDKLKELRRSYRPLGRYHVLLGDQLQTMDSTEQAELLKLGLYTTMHRAAGTLPGVLLAVECITAHSMKAYRSSLSKVYGFGAQQGKGREFCLRQKPNSPDQLVSASSIAMYFQEDADLFCPKYQACLFSGPHSKKPMKVVLDFLASFWPKAAGSMGFGPGSELQKLGGTAKLRCILLDIIELSGGLNTAQQPSRTESSHQEDPELADRKPRQAFELSCFGQLCQALENQGWSLADKEEDLADGLTQSCACYSKLLASAGSDGVPTDKSAAQSVRASTDRLSKLAQALMREMPAEALSNTSLPEPLRASKARFLPYVISAIAALYQDLAEEAMERPAERSQALCKRILQELSTALGGMSIYELALPATRMLLADYRCLTVSLQQLSQPAEARGATLADLIWDDGLDILSSTLQALHRAAESDAAVKYAPAELAEPFDLMPQQETKLSQQPDVKGMSLLRELGMPDEAAARASLKLDETSLRHITTALLPQVQAQLQAYIGSELDSSSLVCAVSQEPLPVIPRWGKIHASADPAKCLIETTNALGKFAWRGVTIASIDGQDNGKQIGGWSFMDENFFYGQDGKQITGSGHGQILLNPQDFDWVLATSGIPEQAVSIGQDGAGQDLYAAVFRQKQDKRSFIAGRAKGMKDGYHASYSLSGAEVVPDAGKGYVMCHRSSTTDQKLDDREKKWCFQEQPVGLLT